MMLNLLHTELREKGMGVIVKPFRAQVFIVRRVKLVREQVVRIVGWD
jgi:hypothetical protein